MHSRSSEARVLKSPTWTEPNDALTEVLRDLRLARTFYCHSELAAPWGLQMPCEDHAVLAQDNEEREAMRPATKRKGLR